MEEKFLNHFDWLVRRPLQRKKDAEIAEIKKRKDFHQVLVIEDQPSASAGIKESGAMDNRWFFDKRQELYERNTLNFNKMFENQCDDESVIERWDESIEKILEKMPQVNELLDSIEPNI